MPIQGDLFRIAKAKLNNIDDVQDAVQETLIIAYLNISKLKYNKYFKTWIIRILINECNKIIKRKKQNKELLELYSANNNYKSSDEIDYEKLDFNRIKQLLNDKERDIFSLYYENGLTTKQISARLDINENTVKSRLKSSRDKLKHRYRSIFITLVTVLIIATGVVFGKDIINYIIDLFNLTEVGYNNDNILDAIAQREWVQNVDMDYITLDDNYSIRVDYLLYDDMNLYMVFDLESKSDLGEYDRFSISDLKVEDENGNILTDEYEWSSVKSFALTTLWKNVEHSNNNIREVLCLISDGFPKMENLKISFSNIVLYNFNQGKIDNNKNTTYTYDNVSFEIKLDDKFINKTSHVYSVVNQSEDLSFSLEKAMFSDTGFYAIVETYDDNLNLILKDNKNSECKYAQRCLGLDRENRSIFRYLIVANIPETSSFNITLKNKENQSEFIYLEY